MKMIVGQCDLCNWHTTTATDPGSIARAVAFHKSIAHGIKGKYNDPEYKRRMSRERYFRIVKGLSPAEVQKRMDQYDAAHPKEDAKVVHRREYQRKWRRDHKAKQNGTGAIPVALETCPFCHSRFYGVKGAV